MTLQADNHPSPQRFAVQLLAPYRRHLLYGMLSLIIVDIADILPPVILKQAIDSIEHGQQGNVLLWCGGALLLTAIIQSIFRFFWRQFFLGTSHNSVYDLRKQLFAHLLKLPFHYFSRTRTGDIMSRLTNDIQEIRFMFGIGILVVLDASFYFLTVPFIMLWLSPRLTFYTMLPFVFMPAMVIMVKNSIHNRSKEVQARLSDLSSRAEENLSGMRVIKGFRIEESEIDRFNRCGLDFVRDKIRLSNVESLFHPALDMVMAFGMVSLLYLGGNMVIAGTITLGSLIAMESCMLKVSWPMMAIGWIISLYQRCMASMDRCLQILHEPPATSDDHPEAEMAPTSYDIEISNLSFSYPEAKIESLKNISFKLGEGQTLGITGPVGSGKSTLLRLLMKMFQPAGGEITIGGVSSARIPLREMRNLFAYVPQETFLFSESIRENILFSQENKEQPEKAAAFAGSAGLESDLRDFPTGLETMLGERGVNLSGGQKQRVSLARAMAAERPILVLDDCTSAVDTETEQKILASLRSSTRRRTCIIVSNRMVSLQSADLIIYLDNGEIAEIGTHQQLLEKQGRYAQAWQRQRLKAELEKS